MKRGAQAGFGGERKKGQRHRLRKKYQKGPGVGAPSISDANGKRIRKADRMTIEERAYRRNCRIQGKPPQEAIMPLIKQGNPITPLTPTSPRNRPYYSVVTDTEGGC